MGENPLVGCGKGSNIESKESAFFFGFCETVSADMDKDKPRWLALIHENLATNTYLPTG
ncbi:hypothetical protein ACPV50_14120 [Vibrio astriarenae]|jgi:hypothetical protein